MSDGLSEEGLRDAYDHASDFLAEDMSIHNLTNIERVLCKSVVGMYATIRDRERVMEALCTDLDRQRRWHHHWRDEAVKYGLQSAIMREVLEHYADENNWLPRNEYIGRLNPQAVAREALAKLQDSPTRENGS